MAYQYPLNGGRINASLGGNSTSAGAGFQLVSTGTLLLAGGNNITLSQNGSAITISGANAPSGSINFSAGTTSNNLASVTFSNSNGVSFGLNNGTLTGSVATTYAASNHSHGNPTLSLTNLSGTTASASNGLTLSLSAPSQSAQTIGGYITGNTIGQSSSSVIDARSLSLSALGGASAGFSNGILQVSAPAVSSLSQTGIISISQNGNTISIGAPAFSAGMSTLGNTAGTTGTVSNQLIFAGGNNITLSQSTGAGGNTISIVGGAGGGGGIALANSQTTYTSGTAQLNASGALTIASTTGQQFNLSVPATSSLSAVGGISISTTGSTVVLSGGGQVYSYFNPQDAYPLVSGQQGNATVHVQPAKLPNVTFDRLVIPMQISNATNSTGSHTVSFHFGIYTRTSATLSLLSSVSTSFAATLSGTVGDYSLYAGQRLLTAGFTGSLPEDQYYFGIMSRTAGAGNNGVYNQLLASQINTHFSGLIGQAVNATMQQTRGLGHYATTTTVLPISIAFSQLNGTHSIVLRQPTFYLASQTF